MLTLNPNPIFRARGITKPYTFLVKSGFTPHAANIIINSNTRVLRLDHIELLCTVLNCEPNDIVKFIPNKGQNYPDNHPLMKLKQDDINLDLQETLANMPYKQLKEFSNNLIKSKID
ncbi:MAG: helix-turn-helix transcriptional regulator [Flavobacterium sp.]|nr:helix-turn-helix transcriptional regulator [Flavobacterium sp.]